MQKKKKNSKDLDVIEKELYSIQSKDPELESHNRAPFSVLPTECKRRISRFVTVLIVI